jgi:adenosylhomocysteine nucleosidase
MGTQDHGNPAAVGALNLGPGTMHVGTAVGVQHHHPAGGTPAAAPVAGSADPGRRRADVGVLTVLHQEMRAVVDLLARSRDYQTHQLYGGAQVHEAQVGVGDGALHTVALQTLDRGPRSAAVAYQTLRRHFAPPFVLLVGIAGGVGARVAVGDVVISDEVIYYDARRESVDGVHRRGQSYLIAPVLRHRLNDYFRTSSGAAMHRGEPFRVHLGPVGSGDVVVTNRESGIRSWLLNFHEKTLAVETEAGGLAHAFYEEVRLDDQLSGWLTVRGVSDYADAAKGYAHHDLAADRAVVVLEQLLPFLRLSVAGQ